MISKELELTLEATIRDAQARHHEYLGIEHILFAVLHDEWGVEVITHCGGSVEQIKTAIETFFEAHIPRLSPDAGVYPQPTVGFHRVLQRALDHVHSSGKTEADAGDVLASIFLEEDSHALHFLQSEGITRLDVLNYISHGMPKTREEAGEEKNEETGVDDGKGGKRLQSPLKLFAVSLTE